MNYAKIIPYDIVNGLGVRTSLFISGCPLHCEGCFNREAWDYSYGAEYTEKTKELILSYIEKPWVAGLSLLGGEPTEQGKSGSEQLAALCDEVHGLGKNVWMWSGHTYEQLERSILLPKVDVLVDGPFKKDLSNSPPPFRGSSNQRIIDVRKTMDERRLIELNV